VDHPWINDRAIEQRDYQDRIVRTALTGNTLCVLPTGLGKTAVAALVSAYRLQNYPDSKILFVAPTKPLVSQHEQIIQRVFRLGPEIKAITGTDRPETRKKLYNNSDIIIATPQTIRNDVKSYILDLKNFSLLIVDEAHRAVGEYAYVQVAKSYVQQARNPLILALTASPGGYKEKIDEIKKRLFIENVEIRNREDSDVKKYVQPLNKIWIEVSLPEDFMAIRNSLERQKTEILKKLMEWRIINSDRLNKRQIIELQKKLIRQKTGIGFAVMSLLAEILKIDHAIILLETQTLHSLQQYLRRLEKDNSKATQRLMKNSEFLQTVQKIDKLVNEGKEHPKLNSLMNVVEHEIQQNRRIIIFTQYRDTVDKIMDELKIIDGAKPVAFIGQANKKTDNNSSVASIGMSQKEQVRIINEFRLGFYNIIVATSIGEEGLDIEETDSVVFYEPIPSEIRNIQRTGRTARTRPGKVIILMTKSSRDEAWRWSSHHKEQKMRKILYEMQKKNLTGNAV